VLWCGACLPVTPLPYQATTDHPGDAITLLLTGQGVQATVTSERGIGRGMILAHAASNGRSALPLELRLHLKGLEQLRLAVGARILLISVTSSAPSQILQELTTGAESRWLTPEDPEWAPIAIMPWQPANMGTAPAGNNQETSWIPLRDEQYFSIEVPGDLRPGELPLELSWIDFFR
jgi:hypothetical protein